MIAKHQKIVAATKLEKAYSSLSQAILLSENDNGPISEWEFENEQTTLDTGNNTFEVYILPYLNKVSKCTSNKCGEDITTIKNINGNLTMGRVNMHMTADGTGYSYFTTGQGYAWIFIDINGPKAPNRLGKDIFMADIYRQGKLKLWGTPDGMNSTRTRNDLINTEHSYACSNNADRQYQGGYCGALIQQDGWKISDDYPW